MEGFKLRLEIGRNDVFYYPDVMVACQREGVEQYFLRYPVLIVEVLSRSTAAIDRREKRINYTQIPTVEEYVIASQEELELLCHRRMANWVPERIAGTAATLDLRSIDLALPLTEIYDRVF
jgi:Uma2 family endonuclease